MGDGRWAIVWSEGNEVGPKPIKPSGPKFIPPSPFISTQPNQFGGLAKAQRC